VNPLVERTIDEPGWYRRLSPAEQEATNRQLWAEGRLKVEPWLEPRLRTDTVTLWPRTEVVAARELPAGALLVRLDNGEALTVDQIILATGYRVDLSRVPFLVQGDVLPRVTTRNGFPMLDNHLQTNVPGLFITSMAATQDFGPFFAFTVSARASARLLGGALVD
jgi:thioredoxin reductase